MSDGIDLVGLPPEGQCGLVAAVAVRSGFTQLVAQKSNVNPRCCRRGL